MTHVDEGTLQAYLDGELGAAERSGLMRHVASCGSCSGALEELRAAALELSLALGHLEPAAPAGTAYAAVRQAAAHRPVSIMPAAGTARYARRALARAAILVLGLAAAASAAIPGSPLREWLLSTLRDMRAEETTAPAVRTPAVPAAERMAGLAVAPVNGVVRISVTGAAKECQIRVRLVEAEVASVYAIGAAADARFESGAGRVEVIGAGPGEVRIDLPASAQNAVVEVDGRAVASSAGGELRVLAPAADTSAAELVFRIER